MAAQVEPLDQDATLVVHGKARGPHHALLAACAHPSLGGAEECVQDLLVVLELEKAEPAPVLLLVLVERVVDLGADASHHTSVAPSEEVFGFAVAEERVHPATQEHATLDLQGRHPQGVVRVQAEGEVDERFQVPPHPRPP